MSSKILYILLNFLFIILVFYNIKSKREYFLEPINNKLCLNHYYTCRNYEKCCSHDNFFKLGHTKPCIHVKNQTNCDLYKKNTPVHIDKTKTILPKYIPGYSYIPFYDWKYDTLTRCKGKNILDPSGIIRNKSVYNSSKINNTIKHKNTNNEHLENHRENLFTNLKKISIINTVKNRF